ncbi:hypothetical protein LXA43DRAFT_645921 [Ganoderma leucocontextum]|nr:hypothetical protein LXA43DRAFT_645921 [Ganoderma leucocontextum]
MGVASFSRATTNPPSFVPILTSFIYLPQFRCTTTWSRNTMPSNMLGDVGFIPHIITFMFVINQFTQSHCSSSLSILATILFFLSLLPFIYGFALFVKDSLISGFSRVHSALAYVKLSDEDLRALLRYVSEERWPGHLDHRSLPKASLPNEPFHESSASSRLSSTQSKVNETNHGVEEALIPTPHVLARNRCARVGDSLPSNAGPVNVIPAPNEPALPRDPLTVPRQLVDSELSAVGQYLARHYGMFAWRIHPLIRAHNAFAGLDASFRRIDMFMHSVRAGMLYHELIIFIDHTAFAQGLSGEGETQERWQMYAARTRACDPSNPTHAYFSPVHGGECDCVEEWENCLQWDALMARVLNTAYMHRMREAAVERWDADAREYWRRGEGLSEARADRVAEAVLAYGLQFPAELAFEDVDSSGSEVNRGIRSGSKPTYDREEQNSFKFEDEFGCVIDLSSCGPDCECGWDEDTSDQGAEVDSTLYDIDSEEELCAGDWDAEHGFKCHEGLGPAFDFGSLDSVLSDATPPPASLPPSSSEASSDTDSECIVYPRLMRSSTPLPPQCESRFLRLGHASRTRIYPAVVEESPSFATSSSSERILADFSAFSLSLSGRASTSMNIGDGGSLWSSSPTAASGFTPKPDEARMSEPSLFDLALAFGTRDSEERKRGLTSSSSYPFPPPFLSLELAGAGSPQVREASVHASTGPDGRGEMLAISPSQSEYSPPPSPSPFSASAARDADPILPNATHASRIEFAPASECNYLAEEIISSPLCTRMDSSSDALPASTTQSPPSSRQLRVMLSLTFRSPPSRKASADPAPVEPAAPRMRTAFSLWDAIMRPQLPRAAGVDIPASVPNSNLPRPVNCGRQPVCGQIQSFDDSLAIAQGVCTSAGKADEFLYTSDGEWEIVRNVKKTRRGGEKARRQRERRRMRMEMAQA